MAKKGEAKSEKRLAASRVIPLKRKENVWHIKTKPGPHKKKNSVALGFVLRNMIGTVTTMKEARNILNKNLVLVDGKVAKDAKRPIGLFDLISIVPEKKTFRLLFSKKGKLKLAEEEFNQNQKLCKVVGKRKVSKNAVQLTTNDGRTFAEGKTDVSVGDSLLIQLPEQKVLKVIKEQPKKIALVIDGKHIGDVAKVKDITPGTMNRPKIVTLEAKSGEFKTVESNIIMVGDEKPLIKVE